MVQERATKKCKVVETRPSAAETTWVQVGPLAFKTREEADKQIAVICKEKNSFSFHNRGRLSTAKSAAQA